MSTRQSRTRATRAIECKAKEHAADGSRKDDLDSDAESCADERVMSLHARITSEPDATCEARTQRGATRNNALNGVPVVGGVPATCDSSDLRAQRGAVRKNHALDGSSVSAPATFSTSEPRAQGGAARTHALNGSPVDTSATFSASEPRAQRGDACTHALNGSPVDTPATFNAGEPRAHRGAAHINATDEAPVDAPVVFNVDEPSVLAAAACNPAPGEGHAGAPAAFNAERFAPVPRLPHLTFLTSPPVPHLTSRTPENPATVRQSRRKRSCAHTPPFFLPSLTLTNFMLFELRVIHDRFLYICQTDL
ncbi:hypothetical protein RR48_08844 [Papilio machaon]|uniref:Uncharacterized protein n=1 Tax=Papilio machaon TaxID=76193 RepID=A0A194QV34_PAPMA|nr:hypothetical protein RR48_08844 [Papilio machaon]